MKSARPATPMQSDDPKPPTTPRTSPVSTKSNPIAPTNSPKISPPPHIQKLASHLDVDDDDDDDDEHTKSHSPPHYLPLLLEEEEDEEEEVDKEEEEDDDDDEEEDPKTSAPPTTIPESEYWLSHFSALAFDKLPHAELISQTLHSLHELECRINRFRSACARGRLFPSPFSLNVQALCAEAEAIRATSQRLALESKTCVPPLIEWKQNLESFRKAGSLRLNYISYYDWFSRLGRLLIATEHLIDQAQHMIDSTQKPAALKSWRLEKCAGLVREAERLPGKQSFTVRQYFPPAGDRGRQRRRERERSDGDDDDAGSS